VSGRQLGVYFLASNATWDLALAFLNSVRASNPSIPLCLIPFDGHSDRLFGLARAYGCSVFTDLGVLRQCDEIGARFHGASLGHYRKLACWEGPFDDFVYIDVDTVVLEPIDFVAEYLHDFDVVASHSHLDDIVRWVWKPSIWRTGALASWQIAYSASTGFIASRRGVLSLDAAYRRVSAAERLARHMALDCKEQPFLNYLMVTSGVRFTSLRVMAQSFAAANLHPRIPLEWWAGRRGARVDGGRVTSTYFGQPILLVHWAGLWKPTWADRCARAIRPAIGTTDASAVRSRLPYASLWWHHRLARRDEPSTAAVMTMKEGR
jgi:hypothetical protein